MSGMLESYYKTVWSVKHCGKHMEFCCPKCSGCAKSYFVGSVSIRGSREEVEQMFRGSPFRFELKEWADKKGFNVRSFPDDANEHRSMQSYPSNPRVILLCSDCHRRTLSHEALQTDDLYWRVRTRHGVLWAYNRWHLSYFRDYISGNERGYSPSASKLPAPMIKASNRDEMVKLIDRALLNGPEEC